MEPSRDVLGATFVAAAALLFGGVVVIGKVIGEELPVASLLAIRFGAAALVLGGILAAGRRSLRPAGGEWVRLLILGGIGYAVESALFFLALERGTAATVTLLFFTYPVWVAVISGVLGRGLPGPLMTASLVAAMAGTATVVQTSGGLDITWTGVAFAIGSAVTFSFYLIGAEVFLRQTSPLVSAMWVSLAAALSLGAVSAFSGAGRFPRGGDEWGPVLAMGLLTAGAFFLLFVGLRR
ncbi:MAG TPA: DMT family transporter, partial [Actinomycetota bacterium]|nr:DMT family transporter [Actinomycetota bacterium]